MKANIVQDEPKLAQIDDDAPLVSTEDDQYGFVEIAKKISPTIIASAQKTGFVIGIEGPWGSGKSTLLAYIKQNLEADAKKTSVVELAPWLLGDIGELPRELFSQVKQEIERLDGTDESVSAQAKEAAKTLAQTLDRYSAATSAVASALSFLGNFVPATNIVAQGVNWFRKSASTLADGPSAIELKRTIEDALKKLDHTFVVLIDDLDRLEPRQATEVLRLVKSVANLPQLTFVICYDRHVLSDAVESNLGVTDGSVFIQKIVQVTYGMPIFEPFALRIQLTEELLRLRRDLDLPDLESDEEADFRAAVDQLGGTLKTPREVKSVLNRVRLLYPSVVRDVYFPDFVRVQLLRILRPNLHDWIEQYLNERSVIENGDGRISAGEQKEVGERLQELLPSKDFDTNISIYAINSFIPGVQISDKPEDAVFSKVSYQERESLTKLKRLGSPFHYKFYFALTAPTSVLNDDQMAELIALAEEGVVPLATKLHSLSHEHRMHGQSWLAHAAQRLQDVIDENGHDLVATNIVLAFAEVIDQATMTGMTSQYMLHDITRTQVRDMADAVLQSFAKKEPDLRAQFWQSLLDTASISWLLEDFLRKHLFDNGVVGDRAKQENERIVTDDELTVAKNHLEKRLMDAELRQTFEKLPDLGGFMFGWRDLCGIKMPKAWAAELFDDPDRLTIFLLGMRYKSISDRLYRPLRRADIECFLPWKRVETVLRRIEKDPNAPETLSLRVKQVREALAIAGYDD